MKNKMVIILLLSIFYLTGCSYEAEESQSTQSFTLTKEKKELYAKEIEEVLDEYYWRCDLSSLLFFEEYTPLKENSEEIYNLSSDSGFDMDNYSGKKAVVATINLLHFNGEKAGLAYFYFFNDKVSGVYYVAECENKLACSLKDRNVFLQNADFKSYETEAKLESRLDYFTKSKIKFPQSGFMSFGKDKDSGVYLASVQDEELYIYKYGFGLNLLKKVSFFGEGCIPIYASFYKNFSGENELAVILGGYERLNDDTNENEENVRYFSEKVVFFDKNMNRIGNELTLDSPGYSCIAADDGNLVIFNDKSVEYFKYSNGKWEADSQFFITHTVTAFSKADLDNDGVYEYIMSDGLDLYLYHKEDRSFKNLWKTHLGIKSLSGYIYTGDLNNDGVKEIYVCDQTGTSIRYILTPKGMVSKNDDIEFGEMYFPGDFNDDGKDDFIKINDIENSEQYIYVSK